MERALALQTVKPPDSETMPETSGNRTVDTMVVDRDSLDPDDGQPDLPSGTHIARYVVQGLLARGGMGVVYRAHDPDLGRDLAIKLLKVQKGSTGATGSHRLRMLREAQALAKLSHPNIVGVHDVGTHEQSVFLAMEFVPGRTLGAWVEQENPGFARTLKMLLEAGRGLSAAHASGLVHRDVKPDNIFVGDDGRARIGDFGLARSVDAKEGELDHEPSLTLSDEIPLSGDWQRKSVHSGVALLDYKVTLAGSVLGTPQYMAAEQFRGELADAQTDQFSFCVTAFESLYGVRPFAAQTFREQVERVTSGEAPSFPKQSRLYVPRRVRRILLRGLSSDAKARYPTLDALLDDLERDPMRTLRRGLVTAAVVGVAGASLGAWLSNDRASVCGGGERLFSATFGPGQRQALKRAFLATGRSYAEDTFERVASAIDAYGKEWRDTRRSACEATRIHQEQSEAVLDLRMGCLDDGLERTRALISVFSASVDGAALDRAVESVQALPPVKQCSDVPRLLSSTALPADPKVRKQVEEVRHGLAKAYALQAAARYAEGMKLAQDLTVLADRTNQSALQAESELLLGVLISENGDARAAEGALYRALKHAAKARDDDQEAGAALDLLHNVGYTQARQKEAMAFLPFAEAAAVRAKKPAYDAELASTLGLILWSQGDYAGARKQSELAVQLAEKHGIAPGQRATYMNNLGLVVNDAGDPASALLVYDRALAVMESTLGKGHPNVAMALNNRGNAQNDLKNYGSAQADFERSLSVWEAALGPEHADLSYPLTNLGAILNRLGNYAEAQKHLERALVLDERYLGPDHTDIAFTLTSLADTYCGLSLYADARRLLERALVIRRNNEVPAVRLAETLFFLAKAVRAQGEVALSERHAAEMMRVLGDEQTAVAKDLRERYEAWRRTK